MNPEGRPQRTTTRDLAAHLGLSHSTVARALNADPRVAPTTQQRVMKAARKLGYRPNPVAKAFGQYCRSDRDNPIGSNIGWINDLQDPHAYSRTPWLRGFHEGALRRARELGFAVEDLWVAEPGMTPERIGQILNARGILGIIVPGGTSHRNLAFDLSRYACVQIGSQLTSERFARVLPDYFFNMTLAFDALLAAGYKRIAFNYSVYGMWLHEGHPLGAYYFNQQRLAPKDRLPPYVVGDSAKWEFKGTEFKKWILEHRPDAVITEINTAYGWLMEMGLKVPEEIGLVHLNVAEDVKDWSGINTRQDRQGELAVERVAAQLGRGEFGAATDPADLLVRGKWVNGTTTRRPSNAVRTGRDVPKNHDLLWYQQWATDK